MAIWLQLIWSGDRYRGLAHSPLTLLPLTVCIPPFSKNYISQDSPAGRVPAHSLEATNQMCAQAVPGKGSQRIRTKLHLLTSTGLWVSGFPKGSWQSTQGPLSSAIVAKRRAIATVVFVPENCHSVVGHCSPPVVGPGCIVSGWVTYKSDLPGHNNNNSNHNSYFAT